MLLKTKTCRGCGEAKPATLEFFSPHKRCAMGLNSRCRECRRAWYTRYTVKSRAKLTADKRAYYLSKRAEIIAKQAARDAELKAQKPLVARAKRMAQGVRERTRELALPVDKKYQSIPFLVGLLKSQPACPCCGNAFELFPVGSKAHQHSPSLDRFRPADGYVDGNVALICWRCNNIKRDYQAADLLTVAHWMQGMVGDELDKFPQQESTP
jgi:hypothetical protein